MFRLWQLKQSMPSLRDLGCLVIAEAEAGNTFHHSSVEVVLALDLVLFLRS